MADYLYSEALSGQPKAIQRFLRRTAVLDQLCGPLCDAVLGSSAAAIQLRRIEAHSLFLTLLDHQRQWYRYHALYREFLLGELRRTEPSIIMTLHQRAADWYESNGSPALALEHLLHTDDWDRAVRLAARLALPTYMAGQLSTVQRWFAVLGDANIARYPPLAVLRCWEGVLTGDTALVERWAAVVDAASFDLSPASGTASFESARAMRSRPSATYVLPLSRNDAERRGTTRCSERQRSACSVADHRVHTHIRVMPRRLRLPTIEAVEPVPGGMQRAPGGKRRPNGPGGEIPGDPAQAGDCR